MQLCFKIPPLIHYLFSQDVFIPTQSQETPQPLQKKLASPPPETQSQNRDSTPLTLPLQLSANTETDSSRQTVLEQLDEDSQATQIEELEEPPGVDTSDSVKSHHSQKSQSNTVSSEPQAASGSKASVSIKTCAGTEPSSLSQKSDAHRKTESSLNVEHVNVKDIGDGREAVSCSNMTVNSCVQETPLNITPCSLPSQSEISQTSVTDMKSSADSRKCRSVESSHNSQTDKNECEQDEEVLMDEETSGGALGMALALSQSQLVSPEPMEEEQSQDAGQDSVIIVADGAKDSQVLQKDETSLSQLNEVSVSTNGDKPQILEKEVHMAPDVASQTEKEGREADVLRDKSLSDSSGG